MIIKRVTEFSYEVKFDDQEARKLQDIEDIFEVTPEDVIERSVSESLRLGVKGIHDLLNVVVGGSGDENGNAGTD